MATPKTILLRVNSRHEDRPLFEAPATDALIMPGHFIQLLSTGKADANTTTAIWSPKWIAVENPYIDPTVVSTIAIDTPYAEDDSVRYVRLQPGDEVYALLTDEENVAIGEPLGPSGTAGEVISATTATDETVFGIALEAVDNTGGSGALRIRMAIA